MKKIPAKLRRFYEQQNILKILLRKKGIKIEMTIVTTIAKLLKVP